MRKRVSWTLDDQILERTRDAAHGLPGRPTISGLVEQALRELIARLERERGEPFAPRPDGATSSGTDG